MQALQNDFVRLLDGHGFVVFEHGLVEAVLENPLTSQRITFFDCLGARATVRKLLYIVFLKLQLLELVLQSFLLVLLLFCFGFEIVKSAAHHLHVSLAGHVVVFGASSLLRLVRHNIEHFLHLLVLFLVVTYNVFILLPLVLGLLIVSLALRVEHGVALSQLLQFLQLFAHYIR